MSVPTWDEWTAHAEALEKTFADWKEGCTPPSQLTDDDNEREYRAYAIDRFPGKGLTWRELLERMDESIWAFYLSKEAMLYYLPAFLMFPRPDACVIGYDLEVLAFPPGENEWDAAVSLEALLSALTDEQVMAVRDHVRLHALACEPRRTFIQGYALRMWGSFWRAFPKLIEMSPEVKSRIDALWPKLGL